MTWGGIAGILPALVVSSLVAMFIDAWWEKRKRDKKTKKGGAICGPDPPSDLVGYSVFTFRR